MARIRTVKPEFWTDETMASLPRDIRLLFIGLLNHVDDAGRCVDNERLIKAAVFPLDDDLTADDIRRWIDELSTTRRVTLYEVSGRRYLEVTNFTKHQRIDRPKPSPIPAPEEAETAGQTVFDEESTIDRRSVVDASLLDREQGMDQGAGTVRVAPTHRRELLRAVAEEIANRRGCRTESLGKRQPARWLAAAVNGIETDIADACHALIHANPAWDAQRLADELEPKPAPPPRPAFWQPDTTTPRPPSDELLSGVKSIRDMLPPRRTPKTEAVTA